MTKTIAIDALESLKGQQITALDVRTLATFTDHMVMASGTSTRHVKALADKVVEQCLVAGVRPLGIEGQQESEWILVDLGDVVVHVMLPQTRAFYQLEKLWSIGSAEAQEGTSAPLRPEA